jgi:adenosylcobinamide-GDP ribazoletransferase
VGLGFGLVLLALALGLGGVLSPGVLAALLLAVLEGALVGGFHLDGLSDTFDALRAPEERRLQALKDSAAGPAGVASVVLSLLLKYALFKAVLEASLWGALVFAPVASRWVMVLALWRGRAAKEDGLGALVGRAATGAQAGGATFLALGILLVLGALGPAGHLLAGLASALVLGMGFQWLCRRKFGGYTGDTMGALLELSELAFLLVAVGCSGFFS